MSPKSSNWIKRYKFERKKFQVNIVFCDDKTATRWRYREAVECLMSLWIKLLQVISESGLISFNFNFLIRSADTILQLFHGFWLLLHWFYQIGSTQIQSQVSFTRKWDISVSSYRFSWVFKSFQGFSRVFYEFDWSSWYFVIKKSNFINRLY